MSMKEKPTFRGVVLQKPLKAQPVAAKTVSGPPKIRVGRETAGRSGKGVSVITGLPLTPDALATLAAELKRICGAGGAVRGDRIERQGEHRERLIAELLKRGYEAKRSGG
jgi:translation initiation factor 1